MTELEGQFYCEHSYRHSAEGRVLLGRVLFIFAYFLFVVLYFALCYFSRFIPLFAFCPLFVWMLVYFTWRYVSHDYYFEFRTGTLFVGIVMRKKKRTEKKKKCEIKVKEAIKIVPLPAGRVKLDGVKRVRDFSSRRSSDKRIAIVYNDRRTSAVVIECTIPLLKLIYSYYGKTDELLELSKRL